jgi:hypothetical protein
MSIPTAEEFVRQFRKTNPIAQAESIEHWMGQYCIEFAKMHVEAALKAASEEVTLIKDLGEDDEGNFICEKLKTYNDEEGYPIYIDEKSILNAYPLNNIK